MRRLIIFGALVAAFPRGGMALPAACPASLKVQEVGAEVSKGWVAVPRDKTEHPLKRVSVYLSHPSKNLEQIPDESCRKRDVWVMHGDDEYWLVCHYSGTEVVVASKIDAGLKECVVAYEVNADRSRGKVRFSCYPTIRLGKVRTSPRPNDNWDDCR